MLLHAASLWAAADLPGLQKTLDSTAPKVHESHKESLLSRKALAQATKKFKKLEDSEKLSQFNDLLKLYQGEIDSLNKRNKQVETDFFSIYKSLAEVPDPTPLLKTASENNKEVVDQLKKENEELKDEIVQMSDYSVLKNKIKAVEQENEKFNNLESNWNKKELEFKNEIDELKNELNESQVNSKMLNLKLQQQQGSNSNVEIIDINEELKSANEKINYLERKNNELSREIESKENKFQIDLKTFKNTQRDQITQLETENARLIKKVNQQSATVDSLQENMKSTQDTLNEQNNQFLKEIESLQKYKQQTIDYEDIKKELDIIKEVQFGESTDIDTAIVHRNKKLNSDLVQLRNENDKIKDQLELNQNQILSLEDTIKKLQKENERLEDDITINQPSEKWDTMSMISSVAPSTINDGKISPAASIAGTVFAQQESLLPIITSQRDRFRSRNKILEDENKRNLNKIIELKRQINSLKQDNHELYEKIRFIEHNNQSNLVTPVEDRYGMDYERQLHPIEQFRLREEERINARLSPWDRILVQVIRAILLNEGTRWAFVAYVWVLHLLVGYMVLSGVGCQG
ncbi:Coy1 protein [Martiniozyma asiatica (nom. inval.)]|nr:Coy1 protein [Martiniozyma asiatica]